MTLFLVRHGATDWSEAGRFNGHTDISLNELGRRQATALRPSLEQLELDSIFSSDLVRCRETAEIAIGSGTPDARLRELDFGELEGLTWEACSPEVQTALLAFDGFAAPGGEPVAALRRRLAEFIGELAPGRHLLFTHGGVIRLLLRSVGRDERVPPGGLVSLEGGSWEALEGG
jgi:probable phosphoglycerate mutase